MAAIQPSELFASHAPQIVELETHCPDQFAQRKNAAELPLTLRQHVEAL